MKQDFRFGQLCSLQANLNRDRKKKSQPYKMEDFAMRPKVRGSNQDNQTKIRANLDALASSKPRKKK